MSLSLLFSSCFHLCFLFLDAVQESTVGGHCKRLLPSHSKLESRVKPTAKGGLYQDLLQFSFFFPLMIPTGYGIMETREKWG